MERARRVRFGPFEVDVRACELRKYGVRLRIRRQPVEILLMLLERPGEVVLRDEIRDRLWADNTVVEFEHSINTAVQKLRDVLGESASAPQYIETVPRRGYRFLGTVDEVERDALPVLPVREPEPARPLAVERPLPAGRSRQTVLAAALLLFLMVTVGWVVMKTPGGSRRLVLPVATREALVSPNGDAVVWGSSGGLVVRRFDTIGEKLVVSAQAADVPTWSPDGSHLAFATATNLYRTRVSDGETSVICPRPGATRGLTWSRNGTLLFAAFHGEVGELYSVPVQGGSAVIVPVPGLTGGMFFQPEFLPDGETFLFTWSRPEDEEAGLYLSSWKGGQVTAPLLLRKGMTAAHYSESNGGELLWVEADNLYAQHLSLRGQPRLFGQPHKVLEGVHSFPGFRRASFTVSRNGVLVWTTGRANTTQLTWFDRRGKVLGTAGPPIDPEYLSIAPDGRHILITPTMGATRIVETGRDGYQLVNGADRGLWTPDGNRLIYREYRAAGDRIMERTLGTGEARELFSQEGRVTPRDLSPDGKTLLYVANRALQFRRIDGTGGLPRQFLERGSPQAKFSPDGKWVAYIGNEDTGSRIYVQAFPGGGLRTQITPEGGRDPVWRGDGKEIIYRWNSTLFSVRVEIHGGQFKASEPEALFQVNAPAVVRSSEISGLSKDGSRILFSQSTITDFPPKVYMMTSWANP